MRIKHRIAATGVTVALSSALALGATGTASAAAAPSSEAVQPAVTLAAVTMPVEPAGCRRVWHPGAWFWWSHAGWDRRHPWLRRWERRQHPGWWDCR